eukprot:Hpha_TRINITY_DN7838_c0_g1::TRINITY_DN7838_c0_g1_i1::g.185728::m.185728
MAGRKKIERKPLPKGIPSHEEVSTRKWGIREPEKKKEERKVDPRHFSVVGVDGKGGFKFPSESPQETTKQKLIKEEFDPHSKEGSLFMVSAVDMHAIYAREQRERQEGRGAGMHPEEVTAEDREAVRQMFTDAMEQVMDGVNMFGGMRELRGSVLGSGSLGAINISAFSKFEEVVLADVQSMLSQRAVQEQAGDDWALQHKFQFYREDVTGLIPSFRWRCENLFGVADNEDEAMDLLQGFFRKGVIPEHMQHTTIGNTTMRYVPRSDVIVINQLLHELAPLFVTHLSKELHRLKSQKWASAGADMYRKLGHAGTEVLQTITSYLIDRIVRLISWKKTRTVIFIVSLGRQVEVRQKEGDDAFKMVKRRDHSDHVWIERLLKAKVGDPRLVYENSANWTSARWTRGETKFWREEEIHLTGIAFGHDPSEKDWLSSMFGGGYNPFGGEHIWKDEL